MLAQDEPNEDNVSASDRIRGSIFELRNNTFSVQRHASNSLVELRNSSKFLLVIDRVVDHGLALLIQHHNTTDVATRAMNLRANTNRNSRLVDEFIEVLELDVFLLELPTAVHDLGFLGTHR